MLVVVVSLMMMIMMVMSVTDVDGRLMRALLLQDYFSVCLPPGAS